MDQEISASRVVAVPDLGYLNLVRLLKSESKAREKWMSLQHPIYCGFQQHTKRAAYLPKPLAIIHKILLKAR